jgi:hypothetical protein
MRVLRRDATRESRHDSPVVGGAAAVSPSTDRAPWNAGAPGDGRIPEARLDERLYELEVVVAPQAHSEHMFPCDPDGSALGGLLESTALGAVAKLDKGTGLQNRRFQVRVLAAPLTASGPV